MNKIIVNQYPDQKYATIFNQKNGTIIRIEDEGSPEPFWCEYGPELIDISITNWCNRGCNFCYKKSNGTGNHMSVENYELILRQAADLKVSQIALGGGNPNQHPGFCEILKITREHYDIVPSYTTNGRGLTDEILEATKKYCGAIAVSAYEPYDELQEAVNKITKREIKTNMHFLLTSKSIDVAISWLENPPDFFRLLNAIVFLNYKPIGRMPLTNLLATGNLDVGKFFNLVSKEERFKIGFDSCSISGIARYLNINTIFVESCEAARFSMFISEDMKMYPCSFMVGKFEGIDLFRNKIQDTWKQSSVFQEFRQNLQLNVCANCDIQKICSGGCPIYPEINFC